MKIVILETYYRAFLNDFYAGHPEVRFKKYAEHKKWMHSVRFAASDAYSHYLKKLGIEAEEIILNDGILLRKWCEENQVSVPGEKLPDQLADAVNFIAGFDWRFAALKKRLQKEKPDVILIKEQSILTDAMVKALKPLAQLIVMQIASPLLKRRKYDSIDLVLTSFPHYVNYFRGQGMNAEYLSLCFDSRVLQELGPMQKKYKVSFVGGISSKHGNRRKMLERLSRECALAWFGYGQDRRALSPELKRAWRGRVWGLEMYQALADSLVTVNYHIEAAGNYANNLRLFEATGVGTCLVTDAKENITDFFIPDKEVLVFESPGELVEKVQHLMNHPVECETLSRYGQQKTLSQHTYDQRMPELAALLAKHLGRSRKSHPLASQIS